LPPSIAPESSSRLPSAESEANVKGKLQEKHCSATGEALYPTRKLIVEPAFGMITSARGIRRLLQRRLKKASAECQLICLTYYALKTWGRHDRIAAN